MKKIIIALVVVIFFAACEKEANPPVEKIEKDSTNLIAFIVTNFDNKDSVPVSLSYKENIALYLAGSNLYQHHKDVYIPYAPIKDLQKFARIKLFLSQGFKPTVYVKVIRTSLVHYPGDIYDTFSSSYPTCMSTTYTAEIIDIVQ